MKIYTIGHSNKAIEDFVNKLTENKVDTVVDVRSIPFSKYNPQFNRFAKNVRDVSKRENIRNISAIMVKMMDIVEEHYAGKE